MEVLCPFRYSGFLGFNCIKDTYDTLLKPQQEEWHRIVDWLDSKTCKDFIVKGIALALDKEMKIGNTNELDICFRILETLNGRYVMDDQVSYERIVLDFIKIIRCKLASGEVQRAKLDTRNIVMSIYNRWIHFAFVRYHKELLERNSDSAINEYNVAFYYGAFNEDFYHKYVKIAKNCKIVITTQSYVNLFIVGLSYLKFSDEMLKFLVDDCLIQKESNADGIQKMSMLMEEASKHQKEMIHDYIQIALINLLE